MSRGAGTDLKDFRPNSVFLSGVGWTHEIKNDDERHSTQAFLSPHAIFLTTIVGAADLEVFPPPRFY